MKERPGQLDYASSGNGSGQHLFAALLASTTGIKMNHIPYKGSGQATTDLLGGQVMVSIPGTAGMVGHIKAGKLRALAVTGAKRSPQLPDVPTVMESGVPGYEAYVWMGLLAPKGTPQPIIDKLAPRAHRRARDARGQDVHGERRHRDRRLDARRVRHVLPRGEGSWAKVVARHRREGRLNDGATMSRTATTEAPRRPTSPASSTGRQATGDVRLFLWEKFVGSPEGKPAVLFVHGSSMASQPTFDLTVPGRPDSSVMDWFAQRGFVCWSSTWKATAAPTSSATSPATSPTAPTISPPRPTTSCARAA